MISYQGTKFHCIDTKIVYNEWGERVEKGVFVPTKSYRKWLEEKEEEKRQHEIRCLKESLDYQYKTYGEVDQYDFQRYCAMIGIKGV